MTKKRTTERLKNITKMNREEEILLTCLRIGHINYTWGYL
jgi:hypothetical protein